MFKWGTDWDELESLVFSYLAGKPYHKASMGEIAYYLKDHGYKFSNQQVGAITKALEKKGKVIKTQRLEYGPVMVEVADQFRIV